MRMAPARVADRFEKLVLVLCVCYPAYVQTILQCKAKSVKIEWVGGGETLDTWNASP